MQAIVQTKADIEALSPEQRRAFLTRLLGASTIRSNIADYPEDYDSALAEGDEGYVAAQWVEQDDHASLERLGFKDRAAVQAALEAQA